MCIATHKTVPFFQFVINPADMSAARQVGALAPPWVLTFNSLLNQK
jgi:hypothetical protein